MTTYLAGPIAGCSDAEAKDWRALATAALDGDVLDPMARDFRGIDALAHAAEIVEGDKADILSASAVLAYCPRPTTGTAMEVYFAWQWGVPVFAVVPEGPISPWLAYHSTAVVRSLDEGIELARAVPRHAV